LPSDFTKLTGILGLYF